jgi:uncharacterized protein YgiB involved in biofilm formation
MVARFLFAQALDHQGYYYGYGFGWSADHGGWSGPESWTSQPVYRVRGDRGQWRILSGERLGAGAHGPAVHTVSETISRGGFGRTAAAHGSWDWGS